MANHNTTTSTTNWIWAQYNASFTLAANILVILKKTSHLGGYFYDESYCKQ